MASGGIIFELPMKNERTLTMRPRFFISHFLHLLFALPFFMGMTSQEAEIIYRDNLCRMVSQGSEQICFVCDKTPLPPDCPTPLNINVTIHWTSAWDQPVVVPTTPVYQQDANGLVAIPAIGFATNTGWTQVGNLMQSLPDAGVNSADTSGIMLTYMIKFNQTGTHYVWIKGENNTNASSDSLRYGLNGGAVNTVDFRNRTWSNVSVSAITPILLTILSVGEHVINIWQREDGTQFSEIRLTKDSTYKP